LADEIPPDRPVPPLRHRIAWLDAARGVALVAMAIYHFIWDLDFFGYLPSGTATSGAPALFARAIAGSFLVLVGFSHAVAGSDSSRFLLRLGKIAGAAALITGVSLAATPETFIYFGILHHIATASVLLLLAARLPLSALGLLAGASFAMPWLWPDALLPSNPALAFLGLSASPPPSNDFVPLFPWFGWVVLGLIAGRVIAPSANRGTEAPFLLGWLGRHSLTFYLLHQPVLLGLVWLATHIVPPPVPSFDSQCRAACSVDFEAVQCATYCQCFSGELVARGFNPDKLPTQTPGMGGIAMLCSAGMTRKP
jgi:uncharacterized membrane protein